ncbi:hypothetical protein BT96DRAFT_790242, partial [Gymnopus androsaceus JB14]
MIPRNKAHRNARSKERASIRTQHTSSDKLKPTDPSLENFAKKIQEHFGWSHPLRDFQINAIRHLLCGKDVLVHAGTGSGKTAIVAGPHVHPSSKGKVTIMVLPLIALQDEQVN